MYDPSTLAFSFPPYPANGGFRHPAGRRPWTFNRFLYSLKPWIGVDIWHVDPERRGTANRTDDSCGWFDRGPGPYADAVRYVLADNTTMFEIERSLATRAPVTHHGKYTYPRMSAGETLAICILIARELELRRWWNGQDGSGGAHANWWLKTFTRKRDVTGQAADLALHPLDNLSAIDEAQHLVSCMAAALNRRYRPWWKHPRWHVHHWQVHFDLARNLKRMLQPCATCGKALGFGYCPTDIGDGSLHHSRCVGHGGPCVAEQAA